MAREGSHDLSHDSFVHDHTPLVVYGQKLSKTRCLTAVRADQQHHRFLVGTASLHSTSNEIHLLEYSEENGDVLCKKLFQNHTHEIWDISCSPHQSDLFFTVYNTGREGYQSTLWKMHGVQDDDEEEEDDDLDDDDDRKEYKRSMSASLTNGGDDILTDLESVVTIDGQNGVVHNVLWEPLVGDRVLTIENTAIREWHLNQGAQNTTTTTTTITEGSSHGVGGGRRLHSGKWNPIDRNIVAVGAASRIVHIDLRQKRPAHTVERAHEQRVQDIDFNPFKQYYFASGGDDGFVKFWDVRNTSEALRVVGGHSHWVYQVKYNPTHDELVLSCSTDSIINLWRMFSISSKCKSESTADPSTSIAAAEGNSSIVKDSLLRTIDENEESVYAMDWSRKNPWVFASASYDGRVLIHQIPGTEKDRLLLGAGYDEDYGDEDDDDHHTH